MAEKRVAEKSRIQRRTESALMLLLPPPTAYALWRFAGPGFLPAAVVFVEFFLVPTIGNVVAASLTSERIAIEEAVRRATFRVFERPLWFVLSLMFVAYLDLFWSALLPMLAPGTPRETVILIAAIGAVTALLMTVIVMLQHQRRRRNYLAGDAPGAVPLASYTPCEWLAKALPLHYGIWISMLLGAQVAASRSSHRVLILFGAMWGALFLEALLTQFSRDRRPPMLWTQFGFSMALLAAVVYWGVPWALFGFLLESEEGLIVQVVGAVAGLLFGTLLMLFP